MILDERKGKWTRRCSVHPHNDGRVVDTKGKYGKGGLYHPQACRGSFLVA